MASTRLRLPAAVGRLESPPFRLASRAPGKRRHKGLFQMMKVAVFHPDRFLVTIALKDNLFIFRQALSTIVFMPYCEPNGGSTPISQSGQCS